MLVEPASGRFRDGAQIREDAIRLGFGSLDELSGRRIEADLAGKVNGVAGADRLRIGADRLRRAGGFDDGQAHARILRFTKRRV